MAYMSQEHKARLAPTIKEICKRYGIKATLGVHNHSTLMLTIKQGPIDFIGNSNEVCGNDHFQLARGFKPNTSGYESVNPYHYDKHFSGPALDFLSEVIPAMYGPDYFDESDSQTDYFHCSHYIDVSIGRWNRPYALEAV
jgi:hypothetical protein